MSFAVTAVVSAASAVGGAAIAKSASDSAAKKKRKWQQRAIDTQREQYEQTREDFAPWREAGVNALAQLGDPRASFEASPGYEFVRNEGLRGIENRFSARGGGGNAMRALNEYNANLASQEFGNWWGRQAQRAGLGYSGTATGANLGTNIAGNISGLQSGLGSDLASMRLWRGQQMNNALQSGLSNMMYGRRMMG